MEIKITADKKLMDALEKIAAALTKAAGAAEAPQTTEPAKTVQEPSQKAAEAPQTVEPATVKGTTAPAVEAATKANKPAVSEPAPTRDEVQRLAIAAIQGGKREGVKALIEKFGGTRVSDVPEANLAAFRDGLKAL